MKNGIQVSFRLKSSVLSRTKTTTS